MFHEKADLTRLQGLLAAGVLGLKAHGLPGQLGQTLVVDRLHVFAVRVQLRMWGAESNPHMRNSTQDSVFSHALDIKVPGQQDISRGLQKSNSGALHARIAITACCH